MDGTNQGADLEESRKGPVIPGSGGNQPGSSDHEGWSIYHGRHVRCAPGGTLRQRWTETDPAGGWAWAPGSASRTWDAPQGMPFVISELRNEGQRSLPSCQEPASVPACRPHNNAMLSLLGPKERCVIEYFPSPVPGPNASEDSCQWNPFYRPRMQAVI